MKLTKKNGFSVVTLMAVFVVLFMGFNIFTLFNLYHQYVVLTKAQLDNVRSFEIAESGIRKAIWLIKYHEASLIWNANKYSEDIIFDGQTLGEFTITRTGSGKFTIESRSDSGYIINIKYEDGNVTSFS